MLAYGFEDLTGAQWALVQALAGRTDVAVSLPYEPGRPAFASLGRTAADLAGLADGRVEELPPAYAEIAHPALAHLERTLFSEGERPDPPPLEGAVRFLEAAGSRGTLELVADEVLRLVRDGTAPEEIGIVCPSLDRLRAPLETALSTAGIPYAFEDVSAWARSRSGTHSSPRFASSGRAKADATSSASSARRTPACRAHTPTTWRGACAATASAPTSRSARCACAASRCPSSTTFAPPLADRGRPRAGDGHAARRLRPRVAAGDRVLAGRPSRLRADPPPPAGARGWRDLAGSISREDVLAALERVPVRLAGAAEPGRVAIIDLLRARTRRFEAVFVLGLEEGSLPRRATASPFLDDDARRDLDERTRARLVRPDTVARSASSSTRRARGRPVA